MGRHNHIPQEDPYEYASQDSNAIIAGEAKPDESIEQGGVQTDKNDLRVQISEDYLKQYKDRMEKVQRAILSRALTRWTDEEF